MVARFKALLFNAMFTNGVLHHVLLIFIHKKSFLVSVHRSTVSELP